MKNPTSYAVPGDVEQHRSATSRRFVLAASIGTVFEWYDFFMYASLATVLASQFFAGVNPAAGFLLALLTFAVGSIVRPVGALIFGRLGDKIGRKKTFLVTVVLMGFGTFVVGLLPSYGSIGFTAPVLLLAARMTQGLALGGEYGGAITYVAEHAPRDRRARDTSWISATGTLGLLLSFIVILAARWITGDQFDVWGWRIPFFVAGVFLVISVKIRLGMMESPVFLKLQHEGELSKAPLSEVLMNKTNLKKLGLAFCLSAGLTSIYMVAVVYSTYFLTKTLHVDPNTVNLLAVAAATVTLPFWYVTGWLCDRFGRKPVLMAVFVMAALTMFPIFSSFQQAANPLLSQAEQRNPITLETDLSQCSFMFNPTGTARFTSACDVAKQALTGAGISYQTVQAASNVSTLHIGSQSLVVIPSPTFGKTLNAALAGAGYPLSPDAKQINWVALFGLMAVLYLFAVLVVTPISPVLVEIFPTRIRYTGISIPYHAAAGWVGGLLPAIVFAISAQTGSVYSGLWYIVGWSALAAIACLFLYRETNAIDLKDVR